MIKFDAQCTKMRHTILIALLSFVFFGCKKESFLTIPSLKYKSVNVKELKKGEIIKFTLSFTDAEGDLDSIYVEKIANNCPNSRSVESFRLSDDIVQLQSKSDDLLVSFGYRVNDIIPRPSPIKEPQCGKNDTCYFRFALLDKAKHHSDTVNSETIVLIK